MSPERCLAVVLALAALAVAACGADTGGTPAAAQPGRLDVVATTTQAADLARNVGGSHVAVHQILAPNADPHDYEVRPDDVRALAGTDVVIRSGGDVDGWLDDAIGASGTDAPIVTLSDHVSQIHDGSDLDPHWWQDPRNAERAVAAIRDALAEADRTHAAAYAAAATVYTRRISALDAAVARCYAKVPAARRKLVTTHD